MRQPDQIVPLSFMCLAALADEEFLIRWEAHLLPLQQAGQLTFWSERHLIAGMMREQELSVHLEQANVIVLLLSADFFASPECLTLMEQALRRRQNEGITVFPLLLRSVAWQESPLGNLTCLPANGVPVTQWPDQDEALYTCVQSIRELLYQSTFFPSSFLLPDLVHPYPLQEAFTGRFKERQMLTEWLTKGKKPLLTLVALGGMGKSSLAWVWLQNDVLHSPLVDQPQDTLETARCQVPKVSRPEGILWWSFYERESHFTAFLDKALSYASNKAVNLSTFSSASEKVQQLLKVLQRRHFLIVLDGFERELRAYASLSVAYQGETVAEDAEKNFRACTDPYAADFLRWAASLPLKSHILITSRLFPSELDGVTGCQREELMTLQPKDALAFFRSQGIQGTTTDLQKVCEHYGYHPLTLRLLAGIICDDPARPGDISVAEEYKPISDLVARKHHILETAYNTLSSPGRELISRLGAFRFAVEYQTIQVINPLQSEPELKKEIKSLVTRGLLLFDKQRKFFDLHPIVREYAYDRLNNKQATHHLLKNYYASIPAPQHILHLEDLTSTIELYHHTVHADLYDEAWAVYSERLRSELYYHLGAYELDLQLLAAFPSGTDGQSELPDPKMQIWMYLYRAMCYERTGRARLAQQNAGEGVRVARSSVMYQSDLAIALTVHAMSSSDLGHLQLASNSTGEAANLLKNGGSLNWQAINHRSSGRIFMYRGDFARALDEFSKANEAFARLGPYGYGSAVLSLFLAHLFLLQQEPERTLQLAQQVREWSERVAYHSQKVQALSLQGEALIALASQKKEEPSDLLAQAQTSLTEALIVCRRFRMLEVEPNILCTLAQCHFSKGENSQAWQYANEALAVAEQTEYRLTLANIHNTIAQIALEMGNIDIAKQHVLKAHDYAWCDGPPYYLKSALDISIQLLHKIQTYKC